MFSRIAAIIVLATSAVLVAAAPTAVDDAPTVTVRDVSGSDAAPPATSGPLSGILGGGLGSITGTIDGITGGLPPPLNGIAGSLGGTAGGLLGGLTGGKGLGGLGL